jgi:hypothetical protein
MSRPVEEIDCSSAEDFLTRLGRADPLWDGNRQFWVFRGHSDDNYKLVPQALRANPPAKLGYTHDPLEGVQSRNQDQAEAEFKKIYEFYWLIDAQGLHVPGEGNLLRTPQGWKELEEKKTKGWPIDDLLPLLALAQHYGVPTRLLDWSDRPLVAAWFAANGAAREAKEVRGKSSRKSMSVWALNLDWIIHDGFPGHKPKMSVYVITAPRASNPNLHAQGGVFTTENLIEAEMPKSVKVNEVNKLVEEAWKLQKYHKNKKAVMVHIKLPIAEAGKLLRLLNQEQVNKATLFPGYQGVADSLKDREFWDVREKVSYWCA